jgi:hypothetical protein
MLTAAAGAFGPAPLKGARARQVGDMWPANLRQQERGVAAPVAVEFDIPPNEADTRTNELAA